MPLHPQDEQELAELEELERLEKEVGGQPAERQIMSQFPEAQAGIQAAETRLQDTMQMAKPDMQGPPMPMSPLPDELRGVQASLGAVTGQLPISKLKVDPFTKKVMSQQAPIQAAAETLTAPAKKVTSGVTKLADFLLGQVGRLGGATGITAKTAQKMIRVAEKANLGKKADTLTKRGLETVLGTSAGANAGRKK